MREGAALRQLLRDGSLKDMRALRILLRGRHLDLLLLFLARLLVLAGLVHRVGRPSVRDRVRLHMVHPLTRLAELVGHTALRHASRLLRRLLALRAHLRAASHLIHGLLRDATQQVSGESADLLDDLLDRTSLLGHGSG